MKKETIDGLKEALQNAGEIKAEINAKAEKQIINEWKKADIEQEDIKEFETARELISIACNGKGNILLTGEGGIGKTFLTINTIKANCGPKEWDYESGYTTPLAFYKTLFSNRDKKVIVVDDLEGIFSSDKGVSLLKGALWETGGKRLVQYGSTSDKLDVPSIFEMKASLIILCNKIPAKSELNTKALLSRTLSYEVDFSYNQKKEIILKILNSKEMEEEAKKRIIEIINQNTSPATINFNLRTLSHLITLVNHDKSKAEGLFRSITQTDEEVEIYFEIVNKSLSETDKYKEWKLRTGKSQRSWYRMKKRFINKRSFAKNGDDK